MPVTSIGRKKAVAASPPSGSVTVAPSPASASLATAFGAIIGTSAAALDAEPQHGLEDEVAVARGAAEHRVAGVAEHHDASLRRIGHAHRLVDGHGLRTWKASRSDQARSASSSARRSASARSPSVTTIVAQPPSATSSQGCIG